MNDPMTDEERIAALLDGRLGARERDALLARLAASDEGLDLLADAAAVSGELDGEAESSTPVTPLRPRGRFAGGRLLALAAVLAGVALVPLFWMQGRDGGVAGPKAPTELLASSGAGLPVGWDERPWGTTRGAGDPLTASARAVRLGALLTDLEVAVRGGDPVAARLAGEVAMLLEPMQGAGREEAHYREVEARAGEPPEQLLPLLREGREAVARVAGAEVMAVGEWAEAGRIAALRHDAAFFRAPSTEEAFRRAAELPELPAPAREALERLRLATRSGGEPEWAALARDLATVLRVLGS